MFKILKRLVQEIRTKEMGISFVPYFFSGALYQPLLKPFREGMQHNGMHFMDFIINHGVGIIVYIGIQAIVVSKRTKDEDMRYLGIFGIFYALSFSAISWTAPNINNGVEAFLVLIGSVLAAVPSGFLLTELAEKIIHTFKKKKEKPKESTMDIEETKNDFQSLVDLKKKMESVQKEDTEMSSTVQKEELPIFHDWVIDDTLINFKELLEEVKRNKGISEDSKYELEQMLDKMWRLNESYHKLSKEAKETAKKDVLDIIDLYMQQMKGIKKEEDHFHLNEIKKIKRFSEEKY